MRNAEVEMGNGISSSISHSPFRISNSPHPAKQLLLQLIPIPPVRGAAGAPHGPQQRDRERQEDEIRRPHRQERRHDQPVAQLFTADQSDIVDGKNREARSDHQPDATAGEANGERHAEQREDQARGRDRQLLLNFDFVDRGALAGRAQPLRVRAGAGGLLPNVREVGRRQPGGSGGGGGAGGALQPHGGLCGFGRAGSDQPLDRAEEPAVGGRRRCCGIGRRRRQRVQLADPPQLGRHGRERLAPHAVHVLARARHDLLHRADRHLTVAAVLVVLRLLERVADARHLDPVDGVEGPVEVLRIGPLHFVYLAVAQREVQIGAAGGISHATGVGQDDTAPLGVPQIVNRHIIQCVRGGVDAGGAQEELPGHDFIDHLFLQLKRRLLALDVDEERPQLVIGARQDLVIPEQRDQGHDRRAADHRCEQAPHADAARLHRRDLVVGGEVAERVQHRDEHRHRQRHGDDERDRQREHFDDGGPREAFAHEIAELFRDLIDEHRERERRQRVSEWREVLPQDVTAQDAHGRSRHYIRRPKSLQGMRRLAQLVLLAFTLVVPRVHAQAPVYTFGVPPLVAPRHPALAPRRRPGARVPPALVARAWADAVLAIRSPLFGPALAAVAVAPAAPPGAPPEAPPSYQGIGPGEHRGVLGQYADFGMQLNLRFELKADQFRNLRCTSQERQFSLSGCSGGFPTISPNPQYAIRTAGVVGQRLHVDVDFDSQREFDANNNLHVWYEGLQDEFLRRVEAGNVTFQAPASRFITAAIPANNFGVQAIAQVGPLELRGILAQQKGNVVKDRFYSVGDVTSQPLDREARDLDYESGRFFFVIDPAAVPGYPALDILQLDQIPRPDSLTVGALRVYRRRAALPSAIGNQNVGGVRAVACGPGFRAVDCNAQREGPFEWEILLEGRDYYVDPTGTWFALANRLDQSDYLAASYITASGTDSVGTLPVDASTDSAKVDTLRLLYDPKPSVTASSPTFRFEIRSAYRVGGREIDRTSVELTLSVNQRERSAAGDPYLQRLGMSLANDATQFDQYNRLFPRTRDPNQGDPVRDLFIVLGRVVFQRD